MKTAVVMILILAMCAGALFGCGAVSFYSYENAQGYSAGACEIEEPIYNLDIDWLAGNVTVEYHEDDCIAVTEESNGRPGNVGELRYRLDGNTLRIRYAAPGRLTYRGSKDLTVLLPEGTSLGELSVDTVSANVYGEDISAGKVSIDTVSGDVRVSVLGELRDFEADTASGNVELYLPANASIELDADTVSGDVKLYLPANASFELETDTVSGDVFTDFACTRRGDTYTCGTGGMELDMDTVSGDMSVLIAE